MVSENEMEGFLFSALADDPDLAELSDEFAEEMPTKLRAIQAADREGDFELLVRLVHQLKGAAGSYGFSMITPFAARLELSLKSTAESAVIQSQLTELLNICERIRPSSYA